MFKVVHAPRSRTSSSRMFRSSTRFLLVMASAVVLTSSSQALADAVEIPTVPLCDGRSATIVLGPKTADRVVGTPGPDVIVALNGYHVIYGGDGDDRICTFGPERDVVHGNSGRDRIFTDSGDDQLSGQQGNDYLYGGAGEDLLRGGLDKDEADGGPDGDVCFNTETTSSCGRWPFKK